MTNSLQNSPFATIAQTLKQERKLLGLTQQQAASQLSISLKVLRNLEQGKGGVTLETASNILRLLGKELRIGDIVVPTRSKSKVRPRRDHVLETLRLVKPVLEKKFGIKSAFLFGSCARDEAKKDSDIDLALVFDSTPSFSTLGRLSAFLETLFDGTNVDIVESDKMKPNVAKAAKKDFIRV